MFPIICKKDKIDAILSQMKEYLLNGRIIKDMHIVDSSDDQIVIILSDNKITEERANDWWSGYLAGMKQALE